MRCFCCYDKGTVIAANDELRPCSRFRGEEFSRWYRAKLDTFQYRPSPAAVAKADG